MLPNYNRLTWRFIVEVTKSLDRERGEILGKRGGYGKEEIKAYKGADMVRKR